MLKLLKKIYNKITLKNIIVFSGSQQEAGNPLRGEDQADFEENYFQHRQSQCREFITSWEKCLDLSKMLVCSVGSGFGGEEYLLKGKVKQLFLIEPDKRAFSFLTNKFRNSNTVLKNCTLAALQTDKIFDIIYTSSPSHWMCSWPFDGVPDDFQEFLKGNLAKDGIFIANFYRGFHTSRCLRSKNYIKSLQESLKGIGFELVKYVYFDMIALVIACRKGSGWNGSKLPFDFPKGIENKNGGEYLQAPGIILVEDGEILKKEVKEHQSILQQLNDIYVLFFTFVPKRWSRGMGLSKIFKEAWIFLTF